MKTFLINAAIVATLGLVLVNSRGVVGSPVPDDVAATIVGGCNGATTGTQSCTATVCKGTCLLIPKTGTTNACGANGNACIDPGPPTTCVTLPKTNPAGCGS